MAFPDVFSQARDVPGWLTEEQAADLFAAAVAVAPDGRVVEIGSHHGRSTIVLAAAGPRVVAVDPFPADWRYGGSNTEESFRRNLASAGVADRVDLWVTTSREARSRWSGPVDLLYIDGKHDYWTVRDDLGWSDHLSPEGTVFVHDAFSSLGVTTALLRELMGSRRLRFVGRTGSLGRLVPGSPTRTDRLRVLAQLPWWLRNLMVKLLLRLRMTPLLRLVGHRDTADPY